MTLSEIRRSAIEPALLLLPARMTSPQAEVLLLAIGLQESQFIHRRQLGGGPGRSFWQGELTVAPSTRRQGHSLYAHTDVGIGFEEHFLEGESMAEALGNTVH